MSWFKRKEKEFKLQRKKKKTHPKGCGISRQPEKLLTLKN